MYSILAGSFHTGKVPSWVSQRQSQPPASCWNQRNHKNVTASVIIPPCCLTACPEKKRVRLPVSLSVTHRQTYMYVCSHVCKTNRFSQGVDVQFANFPFSQTHTPNTSAQTNTSTRLDSAKLHTLRSGGKPGLSGIQTIKKAAAIHDQPAKTQWENYNILKTERHWMILRFP